MSSAILMLEFHGGPLAKGEPLLMPVRGWFGPIFELMIENHLYDFQGINDDGRLPAAIYRYTGSLHKCPS